MASEYPLSLVIRAIDKVTAPLKRISAEVERTTSRATAPLRRLSNRTAAFWEAAGGTKVARGFAGVGRSLQSVGQETLALGAKLGAVGGVAALAFYGILHSSVEAGDQLSEMAQRVGLSVDAYAQLGFAAAQADVDQEQFNSSMDQFNKRLGMAKAGGGELYQFLQKVAPALAQQVKGAKSTEEALGLMTGAFEKVKDPGKRAALAAAAFGKSGLQMGQFLGQGNAAITEQRKRYLELAGSQKRFADGASDLDNAMRETGVAFLGVRNSVMAELFPALKKITEWMTRFIAAHRDTLVAWAQKTAKAISDWVDGGGLDRLAKQVKSVIETVGAIVKAIGGWKVAAVVMATFLAGPWLVAMGTAISSVWSFTAALLANPIGWVIIAIAALATCIFLLVKNWDAVREWWKNSFWAKILAALPTAQLFSAIMYIADLVDLIRENWDGLTGFFKNLWDGIVSTVTSAWEKVKPIVDGISEFLSWTTPAGLAGRATSWAMDGITGGGAGGGKGSMQVAFTGAPKGTRVIVDPKSTIPIDYSVGPSMAPGT